jgi:ferric-dicitrate binding protein FerR (iron transport regulator)
VTSGQVALSTAERGAPTALGVGDLGQVVDGAVSVSHNVDVETLTRWTRGELAFNRAPLRTVAADLSRWYGLDVRVAASVSDRQFTGHYTTESPDDVIASITAATGTSVERHGPAITIVGR